MKFDTRQPTCLTIILNQCHHTGLREALLLMGYFLKKVIVYESCYASIQHEQSPFELVPVDPLLFLPCMGLHLCIVQYSSPTECLFFIGRIINDFKMFTCSTCIALNRITYLFLLAFIQHILHTYFIKYASSITLVASLALATRKKVVLVFLLIYSWNFLIHRIFVIPSYYLQVKL